MFRRLLAPSVPVLLLAVVACGGDDDSTEASEDRSTTTDQTTSSTTSTTVEDGSTTTTSPPEGSDVEAAISLTIDVTADGQAIRSGTLTCGDSASGSGHLADPTAAQAACDLLRSNTEIVTRLVEGPDLDRICTMQYGGPDEAHITGEIDGRAVDTVINRTDGCAIGEWDTLVPVVGPPSGTL